MVKSDARKNTQAMQTETVSRKSGRQFGRDIIRPRCVLKQNATDPFDNEITAVEQTPNHKSPGRAMPETAEEHDDDEIERGADGPDLIATERNVKVVAQESGKRNVPASPEIGEPDGGVGKTEIILEMKAETQSGADGAGGIAGEIEKDLTGEGDDAHPRIERDERTGVTKDAIGRAGEHRVGEHDFFEQAQSHEQQPPRKRPVRGVGGAASCGRKSPARTIGPATNCGKNETARTKSRNDFVGCKTPR